jgi:hypothetical protein
MNPTKADNVRATLDTEIRCITNIIREFEDENLDNSHPMDLLRARLARLERIRQDLYG